jgi:hypothetical protein
VQPEQQFRQAELGRGLRQHDIAGRNEADAAGIRQPPHDGDADERPGGPSKPEVIESAGVDGGNGCTRRTCCKRVAVSAGTEHPGVALKHEHLRIRGEPLDRVAAVRHQLVGDGVVALGTIEGQVADAVPQFALKGLVPQGQAGAAAGRSFIAQAPSTAQC